MAGKNQVLRFFKKNRIGEMESSTFQPESAYATREEDEKLTHLDNREPSVFVSLVLPAFKLFIMIGLSPSFYHFESNSQKFVRTKSCILADGKNLLE